MFYTYLNTYNTTYIMYGILILIAHFYNNFHFYVFIYTDFIVVVEEFMYYDLKELTVKIYIPIFIHTQF